MYMCQPFSYNSEQWLKPWNSLQYRHLNFSSWYSSQLYQGKCKTIIFNPIYDMMLYTNTLWLIRLYWKGISYLTPKMTKFEFGCIQIACVKVFKTIVDSGCIWHRFSNGSHPTARRYPMLYCSNCKHNDVQSFYLHYLGGSVFYFVGSRTAAKMGYNITSKCLEIFILCKAHSTQPPPHPP